MQVNPSSASSANVSGTATLTGASVQTVFASGSYFTRQYTILHSGGLIGKFTGVSGNVPAGFSETLSYTGTDVILNLTANLAGGPSALACGFSINQCNVANTINAFFNNGGALPPNFLALFNLTGGNLANALTLLSGGRPRWGWRRLWLRTPVRTRARAAARRHCARLPGASFIVNGATPAKNSALTSAGAELRLVNGVSLLGKFEGELATHSQTYAGTGTVRYTW